MCCAKILLASWAFTSTAEHEVLIVRRTDEERGLRKW